MNLIEHKSLGWDLTAGVSKDELVSIACECARRDGVSAQGALAKLQNELSDHVNSMFRSAEELLRNEQR